MTVGAPWKHIVRFALPVLLGSLLQQLYSTVDAIVSGILSTMEVNITDIRKEGEGRTVFYELVSDGVRTRKKVATLAQEEGAWRIREITDRH
jgi:Na+-driven multidrug efflux pump